MSDRETLEQLRTMTAVERLRVALKADEIRVTDFGSSGDWDCQGDVEELLEENKQLKADVLYEQERNRNNVHAYQDRIDAALARHFPRYPHGRDNPGFCADCIAPYPCPTFKDLKGEK